MSQDSESDPFGWVGIVIDGKYRVDRVVGEGGFGVVYAGHHLGFDEPIAIKCLKLDDTFPRAKRELFLTSFMAEGKILYRLSQASPNIVRAMDVSAATSPSGAWTPYLVMEWVAGGTLADDLDARRDTGTKNRPLEEAFDLLEPAAFALDAAHAALVVHRDVKPANLLMATTRGRTTIKVLDFGVAKVMSHAGSVGAVTVPGTALRAFTPAYGAPEQFDPRFGPTGPWTDVFALALVFVEVVLGRHAFEGDESTQFQVQSTDPTRRPTPRTLGLPTSDAVERVLQRGLAVEPRNRFQSAGAFWDALGAALHGEQFSSRRPKIPTTVEDDEPPRTVADPVAPGRVPRTTAREGVPEAPVTEERMPAPLELELPTVVAEDVTRTVAVPLHPAASAEPVVVPPAPRGGRRRGQATLWIAGGAALLVAGGSAAWVWGGPAAAPAAVAARDVAVGADVGAPLNDGKDPKRPVLPAEEASFVETRGGRDWCDKCWLSLKEGKWGWAKAECDKGLDLPPESPTPRASLLYNEGLIAEEAKNVWEARKDYEESLSLRENADVRAALIKLEFAANAQKEAVAPSGTAATGSQSGPALQRQVPYAPSTAPSRAPSNPVLEALPTYCMSDIQCGYGRRCDPLNKQCSVTCNPRIGVCNPPDACWSDGYCRPPLAAPGTYSPVCRTDAQCGVFRCNTQFGKCALPCKTHADCVQPHRCWSDGTCR